MLFLSIKKDKERFHSMQVSMRELKKEELECVIGVFSWIPIGAYFVSKMIDEAVSESTASCRRNPRQWFCVKV